MNKHNKNCKVYLDFKKFLREFKDNDAKPEVDINPFSFDDIVIDDDFINNLIPMDEC